MGIQWVKHTYWWELRTWYAALDVVRVFWIECSFVSACAQSGLTDTVFLVGLSICCAIFCCKAESQLLILCGTVNSVFVVIK